MGKPTAKIVEGKEHLVREMSSSAIINTDQSAFEARRKQKEFAKHKEDEAKSDKKRIDDLESSVKQLSDLVYKLMEK